MIPYVLIVAVLAVAYWFPMRRWFGRWGSTLDERTRAMVGDPAVSDPTYTATLAITINARPERIWPWLMQLGYQRGGLYSYDWLDRLFGFLDRPSADRILPEFQDLAVGDSIPIGRGPAFPVVCVERNRALVLAGAEVDMRWVWQFGLYPIDETQTRLVSRNSAWIRPTIGTWVLVRALEPAAFVMTRKMLIGIKRRAEMPRAANGEAER